MVDQLHSGSFQKQTNSHFYKTLRSLGCCSPASPPHLPIHSPQSTAPLLFLTPPSTALSALPPALPFTAAMGSVSCLIALCNVRASQCTSISALCPSLGHGSSSGGTCGWKAMSQPQQYAKSRREIVTLQLGTILPRRLGLNTGDRCEQSSPHTSLS